MQKKTKKALAIVGGLGVLGVGGYLLYKHEHAATAVMPAAPSSGGGTNTLPANPGNPSVNTGDQNVSTSDQAAGSDVNDPGSVYTNG